MFRHTYIPMIGLALIAALGVGGSVRADIDYLNTQDGGVALSGTRATVLVNDLDRLLIEFNNEITWDLIVGSDPVSVLTAQPYDQRFTLGELMEFQPNTKLIYDRLAVRAIVQIIGYDGGELPAGHVEPLYAFTDDKQLIALPVPGIRGGSSSARGEIVAETPQLELFQAIPEPSSLILLALGSSALIRRSRRSPYRSHIPD